MKRISLDGTWKLACRNKGIEIAANVPGCVHTDLKNAGLINDLFYRDNAEKYQWIENEIWEYSKEFKLEDTKNAYLVFGGLDTYCDIFINGNKLSFDDMFIEHRIKADELLKKGTNTILAIFYPPAKMVENEKKLPGAFTTERLHTRRIQCTYGWDWVQRFVTFGISKPVYIEYEEGFFCSDMYVYTAHLDAYGAQISVCADFCNYQLGDEVSCRVIAPGGEVVHDRIVYIDTSSFRFDIDIENPILWDISTRENSLYTVEISSRNFLKTEKVGIRTLRVLQKKDKKGSENYNLSKSLRDTPSGKKYDFNEEFSSFDVILNGRKILCKGANWVPCEPFVSEETDEKITKILTMAKAAGMNTVRVWGGGIFEKDHFYNECDRLGLLVIQDFLMACGQYPEDNEDFIKKLQSEAMYAVKKLRNHPSLMWWNGDNENAIEGSDKMPNYRGRRASMLGAMPYINRYDYTRPFYISSPYGGNVYASKTAGTTHHTQFLRMLFNYIDGDSDGSDYLEALKEYTARFIAEEPCFGASSMESMLKFMTEDDILNKDDMWLYHTKGNPNLDDELYNYFSRFAEKILGKFQNGEDRHFKYQYLQYEWVRVSMENTMRNRDYTGGIIYWMLNDCWPSAAGWSLIDYYLKPKAGYYAFKNASGDSLVSITKENDGVYLYLANANEEKIEKAISLKYIDYKSSELFSQKEVTLKVGGNTKEKVRIEAPHENIIIIAECDGYRTFFKEGNLLIEKCTDGVSFEVLKNSIILKSNRYVHAVELCGECVFEDNFVSLLNGEERTIKFCGDGRNIRINAYCLK